jgi:hypothetical protein
VRRDVAGAIRLLVLPTIALGVVVAFIPGRVGLVMRIYALVVCAVALAVALGALRRVYPPERRLRMPGGNGTPHGEHPSTLARIEHEAALGVTGSFDLHYRLVPRLRSVASGLLESRRRISLETQPEEAETVLGPEAWELVRPDRAAPADRLARGIAPDALRRVVDSLERV